jgi:UDP-GlcNAc:undecaprenyl-phosphate/decaprenyl-phosphate GlcNAc-1-phosphate transferase
VTGSRLRAAAVAATVARLSYTLLRAKPPAGRKTWTRTNHRGEPITLLEGPAVTIGAVAGVLAGNPGHRTAIAAAMAGVVAAGFGGYDDIAGNGDHRGFRGHISALRDGELTTGAVKLAGIGVTGLAAAVIARRAPNVGGEHRRGAGSPVLAVADVFIDAGLIAGGANLLNLFDLRPGRAIKVAGAAGAILALAGGSGPETTAPLAAAAALLPEDLAERSMLGDAGANALGAMLGVAAAASLSRPAKVATLAVVTGLTAASEVVSFTRVIERTGPLRWVDMLGRRPSATKATEAAEAADVHEADVSSGAAGAAASSAPAGAGGAASSGGAAADLNGEQARPAEAR